LSAQRHRFVEIRFAATSDNVENTHRITNMTSNRDDPRSKRSGKALAANLRVFCALQFLGGLAYIVFSCVIIFPPENSVLCICLWIVGTVTILASTIGFIAASPRRIRCCLAPYLTLSGLVIATQTGVVLYLFLAPDKAIRSVIDAWTEARPTDTPPTSKIHDAVYVSRWVLLAFIVLQILAVGAALLLRCWARRPPRGWQAFSGNADGASAAAIAEYDTRVVATEAKLAQLKTDVLGDDKKKQKAVQMQVTGAQAGDTGDIDPEIGAV
jgi:hypothetical protein